MGGAFPAAHGGVFRRLCGDAPAGRLAVALGGEVRRDIRGCGDGCARRRSVRQRRRGLAACAGAHAVLCGGFSDRAQLCRGGRGLWAGARRVHRIYPRRGAAGMGEPAARPRAVSGGGHPVLPGASGARRQGGGAAALPGRARRHDGAGRRAAVHGGAAVRGLCARCGGVRRFGRIRREGRAFRRDRPPAQRRAFALLPRRIRDGFRAAQQRASFISRAFGSTWARKR